MNQKKIIIWILVVFALAVVGVFGWLTIRPDNNSIVQKNSQFEDWRIYQNEKYGFEIKYPSDWSVLENSGQNFDRSVISLTGPETQKKIQDKQVNSPCDLSIYYYPSVADEPENYDKATTVDEMINQNHLIKKIGLTSLGGIQATDVVWGGNGAYYTLLILRDDHLYKISFCSKDSRDSLTSTEQSILGTFQFLK